jgi:hypothetical protein
MFDLSEFEHDALQLLARRGLCCLGPGSGEVATTAAIRLELFGLAKITARDGVQEIAVTPKGRALAYRGAA